MIVTTGTVREDAIRGTYTVDTRPVPSRPPVLITGPGRGPGLTLDLPYRLLEQEFGARRVVRFEDIDFPVTLTHEPTRRFLRDTGLPEDGRVICPDTDIPLPTLTEFYAFERPGIFEPGELPPAADRFIRVGRFTDDTHLVLDGATGALLTFCEQGARLHPLHQDVSTLAFVLWLLHREQRRASSKEAAAGIEPTHRLVSQVCPPLPGA
ncbi:SUKH-4 family immunity protein [Streptomyces echinoruber]|nr:SUKH-4 family immunity protein [Streptomyces echinoruber]